MTKEKLQETLEKVKDAITKTEQLFYQLKGQETLLMNQIVEEEKTKEEPKKA